MLKKQTCFCLSALPPLLVFLLKVLVGLDETFQNRNLEIITSQLLEVRA
jgi:hypothetical protein